MFLRGAILPLGRVHSTVRGNTVRLVAPSQKEKAAQLAVILTYEFGISTSALQTDESTRTFTHLFVVSLSY